MIDCTENLCLLAALVVLATLYATRARAAPPNECSARVASARATTTVASTEGPPNLFGDVSEGFEPQFAEMRSRPPSRKRTMTDASAREASGVTTTFSSPEVLFSKRMGTKPPRAGVSADELNKPPPIDFRGCHQFGMSEAYSDELLLRGLDDGF